MNYAILRRLAEKLYFTVKDLEDILGIKPESARVLCSRYVKAGVFVRLKNNFYVLQQNWDKLSKEDFFRIANLLQVPSYISFMTALSAYEVTTQVQRGFFESAAIKRSVRFNVLDTTFNYYKLKKEYYFDFLKSGQYFIASKEKAFLDSVYLYSFGKYKLDLASLDLTKLSTVKIKKNLKIYPIQTKLIMEKLCKI